MYSEQVVKTPPLRALGKLAFMAIITALAGWCAYQAGIAPTPRAIVAVRSVLPLTTA